MRVFYITREAGDFYPLDVQMTKDEFTQTLKDNRHICPATAKRSLGTKFAPKLKRLTWCTEIGELEIFAVLFPDATVWDSVIGDFYTDLQDWCKELLEICQEKYS